MNVVLKIFLAILAFLFIEIFVFIEISLKIGFFPSFVLLAFFSVSGYLITKKFKGIYFSGAMNDYMEGRSPSSNMVRSTGYFIAGILFLIPGFISDLFALLFLIPVLNVRLVYIILKYIKNKFNGNFHFYSGGGNNWGDPGNSGYYKRSFTFTSLPFFRNEDNKTD